MIVILFLQINFRLSEYLLSYQRFREVFQPWMSSHMIPVYLNSRQITVVQFKGKYEIGIVVKLK